MPTLDHIVLVARGGSNAPENLITVSMNSNSDKGHWTLEERGLNILPQGNFSGWDGLTGMFTSLVESDPRVMQEKSIHAYYRRAKLVLDEYNRPKN